MRVSYPHVIAFMVPTNWPKSTVLSSLFRDRHPSPRWLNMTISILKKNQDAGATDEEPSWANNVMRPHCDASQSTLPSLHSPCSCFISSRLLWWVAVVDHVTVQSSHIEYCRGTCLCQPFIRPSAPWGAAMKCAYASSSLRCSSGIAGAYVCHASLSHHYFWTVAKSVWESFYILTLSISLVCLCVRHSNTVLNL